MSDCLPSVTGLVQWQRGWRGCNCRHGPASPGATCGPCSAVSAHPGQLGPGSTGHSGLRLAGSPPSCSCTFAGMWPSSHSGSGRQTEVSPTSSWRCCCHFLLKLTGWHQSPCPTTGSGEWEGEGQALVVPLSRPQGPRQGF